VRARSSSEDIRQEGLSCASRREQVNQHLNQLCSPVLQYLYQLNLSIILVPRKAHTADPQSKMHTRNTRSQLSFLWWWSAGLEEWSTWINFNYSPLCCDQRSHVFKRMPCKVQLNRSSAWSMKVPSHKWSEINQFLMTRSISSSLNHCALARTPPGTASGSDGVLKLQTCSSLSIGPQASFWRALRSTTIHPSFFCVFWCLCFLSCLCCTNNPVCDKTPRWSSKVTVGQWSALLGLSLTDPLKVMASYEFIASAVPLTHSV